MYFLFEEKIDGVSHTCKKMPSYSIVWEGDGLQAHEIQYNTNTKNS